MSTRYYCSDCKSVTSFSTPIFWDLYGYPDEGVKCSCGRYIIEPYEYGKDLGRDKNRKMYQDWENSQRSLPRPIF